MSPAKVITAKFPGVCATCRGSFAAGASISWAKGADGKSRTQHVACASGSAAPAPAAAPAQARKPRTARARKVAPPPAGPELRNDRSPYHVGHVLVAQLTGREVTECEARQGISATEIPGEPCKRAGDRRVAVVVIHTDRMSQSDADDNGYCGRYGAVVRLATAAEAAPILAERAALAAAKDEARAWDAERAALTAGRISVEGGRIDRAGAELLHEGRQGTHGTVSERWSRLADGSILVERWAYDDDRWGRWVTTEQLLEMARTSERSLEDAIRGQAYSALDRAIVWLAAQEGRRPRPPVTVTLCGLDQPVTLEVRRSVMPGMIVARPTNGEVWEWTWRIDQLREQLAAAPPAEVFSGIEFAPGAEIGGHGRLPLSDGLWIDGMHEALAALGVDDGE